MVTVKRERRVYDNLVDHYFYRIQEILRLSEEITHPQGDGIILRKGQELMIDMIKMYLLLMEMMIEYPGLREIQKMKGLYNNNLHEVRNVILREIKDLRVQYLQGLKARYGKINSKSIKESYCHLARKNLYHYQEIKKKYYQTM